MSDPVRNYDHKTIQFRRGTTAEWNKFGSTCVPAEAEICVEFYQTPTGARDGNVGIKVGNGVSSYNQLPHIVSNEESDPVFTNHPAYQITQDLIDSWNDDAEGISDAPDSKTYSRQKGVWVEAPTLRQVTDLQAKVDGLDVGDDYDDTQIKADLATETQARIDGDAAIQSQVDSLEGYDDTQIKSDLATETQGRVDGDTALGLRIDAVEDSVVDGGGFIDAPNDGKLYGRQSESWAEVPEGGSGGSNPPVYVGEDAPADPETGELWFDTDNNTLNLFDGDDWINIAAGSKTIFTLPVAARSGVIQLPVSDDADNLPVSLRSGSVDLPLNESGDLLAVTTRGGEIQLPLAS